MQQAKILLIGFFIIAMVGCSDKGHSHDDSSHSHSPNKHDSIK